MKNEDVLHYSELATTRSVASLGLISVKQLQIKKTCAFYVNKEGLIKNVPLLELQLDVLPEVMALQTLEDKGYTDEELERYLRERDERLSI